jgi:hypothetical protein
MSSVFGPPDLMGMFLQGCMDRRSERREELGIAVIRV